VPKERKIIELARITTVFNDSCILKLASVAKLPAGADLDALGWWIREAAEMFVLESRIPTRNDLHREIAALYQAASRRNFDRAGQLRDMLSPEALAIIRVPDTAELNEASAHVEAKADRRRHRSSRVPERFVLPAAAELRDPMLRDQACAMIASLCRIGGRQVEGRTRRSGKRSSPTLRPELNAPAPSRNILRREAERNFVKRISIGWCKATGKEPPRTARRAGAERDIGPFARLVRECLRLLGASYADPVALINEVPNERKQRTC
jgi:hypothetical protein